MSKSNHGKSRGTCSWKLTINIILILIIFFIIMSFYSSNAKFEEYFLIFTIVCVCILSSFVTNIFTFYLLIELQTFCILVILGSKSNSSKIAESSLKYLILSGIVSVFFLLGVFFVFYSEIWTYFGFLLNKELYSSISNLLLFSSLSFKFGFVPLHFWLLDIYESSTWKILSIIVTIPKLTYLFLLFRFSMMENLIIIIGVLCLIFGALGAFNQIKIKRLLGYSSITQSGFLLYCLLLPSNLGFTLALLYFFIYITSFLTFIFFCNKLNLNSNIFEFGRVLLSNKILSIILMINILSIAGFPPFSGFISKWYVIFTFIQYQYIFISLTLILFSIIGMGYYLNLIKCIFFETSKSYYTWMKISNSSSNEDFKYFNLIPYFSFFFVFALFLNPDVLFCFLV